MCEELSDSRRIRENSDDHAEDVQSRQSEFSRIRLRMLRIMALAGRDITNRKNITEPLQNSKCLNADNE